jgi:hypothetical protein
MSRLGFPMKVFVFDGTLDEFRAECRRQGIEGDGAPGQVGGMDVKEFYGKVYIGMGDAIRDWPRARPVPPGPQAAEWLDPSPVPEAAR